MPALARAGKVGAAWSRRSEGGRVTDGLSRGQPTLDEIEVILLLRGSESRLRSDPQSLDRSQGFGKDGHVQATPPIAIAPIQAKMSCESNEDAPTCDLPWTT